ncbi:MAG: 2-C-methyl-D-erythritol 4-phosphate cytidylyltransferase [Coriobacteriaceae bacterium]|nr:2-C-methyl-D-erythritol 4-phosphate cytidylyltransferase [Coriobacteriaceae bacterium]
MARDYKRILLLMMGGSGTRFGADIPKQFVEVEGKPTFIYLVEKYAKNQFADQMVVVCHESWLDFTEDQIAKLGYDFDYTVVAGGQSRSESVRCGLQAVADTAQEDDIVFIHDVTHPYVDEPHLEELSDAAHRWGGATMGECQYDTVYKVDDDTKMLEEVIPRQSVVTGASPEAFEFGRIWSIYDSLSIEELENYTSAGALALAYDIPMEVIPTDLLNLKITYRHDMEAFEQLFHDYYF